MAKSLTGYYKNCKNHNSIKRRKQENKLYRKICANVFSPYKYTTSLWNFMKYIWIALLKETKWQVYDLDDVPRWVLGLTENDLAYQNVLTRVTPGMTNPCKSGLWDVLLVLKFWVNLGKLILAIYSNRMKGVFTTLQQYLKLSCKHVHLVLKSSTHFNRMSTKLSINLNIKWEY